jgi:hypothetical protein
MGGSGTFSNGDAIQIGVSFRSVPFVVTNAYLPGRALISGALDPRPEGFDLSVVDQDGTRVNDAAVTWLAVVPSDQNGFVGGAGVFANQASIHFTPSLTDGPSYVASAASGARAAAVDNRPDGFQLSLTGSGDDADNRPWTQWLGYAGPPAGTLDEADGSGYLLGAALVARAEWEKDGTPEATLPLCFALSDDPQGRNLITLTCTTVGGASAILRAPALATGATLYVRETPPPGWIVASANPVTVTVPPPMHRMVIRFANAPDQGASSTNCRGGFLAQVTSGPSVGLAVLGALTFRITPDGRVAGEVVAGAGGSRFELTGEAAGGRVLLTVNLGADRLLNGIGWAPDAAGSCLVGASGTFIGPETGDSGSWELLDVPPKTDCGGQPCNV